jgi:hypothetical protein
VRERERERESVCVFRIRLSVFKTLFESVRENIEGQRERECVLLSKNV